MSLHVLFRVADGDYALPAAHVLQMEAYEGATPIPNASAEVVGIVSVRGLVIPVIDLRARFGFPPAAERGIEARIVVAMFGDRTVGLLADHAREVASIDASDLRSAPPIVRERSGGVVESVVTVETSSATGKTKKTVMIVSLEKLLETGKSPSNEVRNMEESQDGQ